MHTQDGDREYPEQQKENGAAGLLLCLVLVVVFFVDPTVRPAVSSGVGGFFKDNDAAIEAASTLIIAVFTVTLWFSTAKMQEVTTQTLDHLKREFEAEHRPWLAITKVKVGNKLHWPTGETDIGTFSVDVYLRNTGRTPALHVFASAVILPAAPEFVSPVERQSSLSSDSLAAYISDRSTLGRTVFPNVRRKIRLPIYIKQEDVKRWRQWLDKEWRTREPNGADGHLVGVILYRSAEGETRYQTGFIRELHRTDTGSGFRILDPRIGGDIPAEHIVLSDSSFGDGITN